MAYNRRKAAASPKKTSLQMARVPAGRGRTDFLGLTARQRFILALTLLLVACTLSSFCLILTEKMVLPF